jgi:F0F1-type ATP synthase epsilon subunit
MSFFGRTELDPNARLHVVIEDTGTILFQGEAYAISSTNELGPFDILPYHNNFISIVRSYITIHKTKDEKVDLQIESGVLRQTKNNVQIFVGVERLNKQAAGTLPNTSPPPVK